MNEWQTVKRLGGDRVGHYAVLWGDAARRDLTGEFFTPRTADLDALFKAVGRLPLLYQHTMDDQLKTSVVGLVDVLTADAVGLWYEAQLTMAGEYRTALEDLIGKGALGTSSGTLPAARKVNRQTGEITRWAIAELSLTPTPAEPRMMARPVEAIKAAFVEAGLDFPHPGPLPGGEGANGEKAANMADWLESRLHREFTVIMDDLFGDGTLRREERIALSGAIGSALDVFHTVLNSENDLIGLYRRGPWDEADPNSPARGLYGEKNVSPAEELDRGAENARSAKDRRADSGTGSVGDRPEQQVGSPAAGDDPARPGQIDIEMERLALLKL